MYETYETEVIGSLIRAQLMKPEALDRLADLIADRLIAEGFVVA